MTTFSDTFTQGGQTQLHKFRMIKQVIGATFKLGLGVLGVIFALLLYKDHGWQDFWFLLCYGKAYVRIEHLSFFPYDFFDTSWIVNRDGSIHEVRDAWLLEEEHLQTMVSIILLSILKKFLQSLVFAISSLVIVSWFWIKMGRKKQETKILSGFELVPSKTLKKLIKKRGASSYKVGDIPLPENAEFQHMMVTGTTGSGKSNMIHHLLKQIRVQGDQAVIVDTTGGMFSRFYQADKDLLLNPLEARSQSWNMWSEIKSESILDEITDSLIPDNRSMDSFWVQSARQVFADSVRFLLKRKQTSYKELVTMILKLPLKTLRERLNGTIAATMVDPAIDKTALSIRVSLAQNLRIFDSLEETQQGFSVLNFLEKNTNQWLFLSCQTDQREFLKPIFSVWISILIKGIMRRSEHFPRKTWIIIDELASLNRLPSLLTGLAEVRKYGGCFVLGFQDLSQLDELYGHATTKTLSNLTGTKVLFRCVDTDVAAKVARYLGEQEKQEASESISFGAHQMRDGVNLASQTHTKPVVSASEIMMLKDLECFLKFPGALPATKLTFDYLKFGGTLESFQPKSVIVKDEGEIKASSPQGAEPLKAVADPVDVSSLERAERSFGADPLLNGDGERPLGESREITL